MSLVNAITFPGVMVHEWAHKRACEWRGVPVYEVAYLDEEFGGHVRHGEPESFGDTLAITLAPWAWNTALAICVFLGMTPLMLLDPYVKGQFAAWTFSLSIYAIWWVGLSIGFHSIPSTTDAGQILSWRKRQPGWRSTLAVIAASPAIALIYAGRWLGFWLYGLYSLILFFATAFTWTLIV